MSEVHIYTTLYQTSKRALKKLKTSSWNVFTVQRTDDVRSCLTSSEQFCADVLSLAREARSRPMGVFHPAFSLLRAVKEALLEKLPADAHCRASGRLCVSLTRVADGKNVLVSEFDSREELIQVQQRCQCYSYGDLCGLN